MNTPVIFTIAQTLKEKGFDKPTNRYRQKSAVIGNETILPTVLCKNPVDWNNYSRDVPYYSIPIITEVVMWLYEKHGIWIEILLEENRPWNKFYYRVMKVGQYFTLSHNGIYKKSPTEAYEAAIEYTLNNLI